MGDGMNWRDDQIPNDDEGRPMFKGSLSLLNDKNEWLASVVWFYDEGPFYAHAMDPSDTNVVRRIGPITTLEAAKDRCIDALEGRIPDLSKRAGYPR
ncbi:hypothetical protein H8A97_30445 [Bradyrhizobium sp. Arg62]|uniref:hypothetical protein n=1 Tax=Bradyrhizobium brasilense TaxID=1419277 RepID=UPI001E48D1AC|nr:hypothetical protein [Bradyrhizobium brasilense]MCC8949306.1 hypothetical protein [Bradyrhizobium brasilense]